MVKQPNFFHSQPSSLPEEALAKFYLSTTFGSSFMISSVAPTRSSTSYAYLITKIANRNLNRLYLRKYSEHIAKLSDFEKTEVGYKRNSFENHKNLDAFDSSGI